MSEILLEIRNATKTYVQRGSKSKRQIVALENFNLAIPCAPASIITIAGESGSGKSTLANLVLGFTKPTSGQVIYQGQDMAAATPQQQQRYRREVQAVFQDPFGVYNPFYRVQHVFDMVIRNFRLAENARQGRDMIEEALNIVGLHGEDVLRKYPHQLSGGQRQRIMFARAYMVKPRLIVADEPVSMVDASLRAAILDVMMRLRADGISFLYITHDLSTAFQVGDQIFVLYHGAVAETGQATEVIRKPHHPYVQLLISSIPDPDPRVKWQGTVDLPPEEEMRTIDSPGCRFHPRCPQRMPICLQAAPPLYPVSTDGQRAACYLYDQDVKRGKLQA
ncbi:MAG: ABC transporter ATP-binding protein [Anaerolineae bacterium]|nr:ABC transporter ATP-binding protein [Anaerolineae bacterium]MDW8171203.1 ABC transporter ATP-binding protein [Anaerolineae bacterium]